MREFNIGDRAAVKKFDEIPKDVRNRALGRVSGNVGTVTDKFLSETVGEYVYVVQFDKYVRQSNKMWRYDHLRVYAEAPKEYKVELDIADNVVVTIITENGKEICRGHGHIIHEGAIGVIQAISYATKKAYEKLNGGALK